MPIRLGPGNHPRIGAEIRRQFSDFIVLPWLLANGQPFAPHLHRRIAPGVPVALIGGMVLCPAFPSIVRTFMVIGVGDHRKAGVKRLQLRVHSVTCIAQAVVRQGEYLVIREHTFGKLRAAVITAACIFVNIIAHVQHQIDVVTLGRMTIRVEFAEAQIGAGEYCNVEIGRLAHR